MLQHTIISPQIYYAYFCAIFGGELAYKAVIIGGSGLIGRKLINILLQWPGYDEVICLSRKKLSIVADKLTQVIVDFDHLEDYAGQIHGHACFCCIGTTKSKTPDLAQYRKIDHDYPVKLAEIAKKNGMSQYHFISSIGADKASKGYYLRFKGETEEDIKAIGLPALHIYRPSILIGHRQEGRVAETILAGLMKVVNPLLVGSLKKYRSISANTVALAMFKQSLTNTPGIFTYESDEIEQLA